MQSLSNIFQELKRRWHAPTPDGYKKLSVICTSLALFGGVVAVKFTFLGTAILVLNGLAAMFGKLQEIK